MIYAFQHSRAALTHTGRARWTVTYGMAHVCSRYAHTGSR